MSTPTNPNAGCVGPASEQAGKASACEGCPNKGACSSGAYNSPEAIAKAQEEAQSLQRALVNVSHVVLVLSGKGGVGKSTLASQLAHSLASQGFAVGLLDVDLCGPSAPRMALGNACTLAEIHKSASGAWIPVYSSNNLAVMSISFLLENAKEAVIWRGPRKNALIKQFLTEVDWSGETDGLDYLIVDTPPGTSDEHISTVQYLQKADAVSGAIIVTTPEEVSLADVRKEINFCQKTKVPILGVVENMGSFQTPLSTMNFISKTGEDCTEKVLNDLKEKCPEVLEMMASTTLFSMSGEGAKGMAAEFDIPYWGNLPLDSNLLKCCEEGQCFIDAYPTNFAAQVMKGFAQRLSKELTVDMGK
jgi:Mrp family chromosome partitioning ATPase